MSNWHLREDIVQLRLELDARAEQSRAPQIVVNELERALVELRDEERAVAEALLIEWAVSEDPKERFDGVTLIRRLRVVSALPALESLVAHLEGVPGGKARDEHEWISAVVKDLRAGT
jgi:hypothetical protein